MSADIVIVAASSNQRNAVIRASGSFVVTTGGLMVLMTLMQPACGGGSSPKSFEASYTPANAPASCMEAVDREGHGRCVAGDGEGCAKAVHQMTPAITFADAMKVVVPRVHTAQMECLISYASQGCKLGSGYSCMVLGKARALLGDKPGAHDAWIAGCDRSHAESCWYASGIGAAEGPWNISLADVLLAERGCDLGSFNACAALGSHALFGGKPPYNHDEMVDRLHDRPGDIARGYYYWERSCLLSEEERRHGWGGGDACKNLRKLLTVPDAPRRNEDDLLPILMTLGGAPQAPKEENWCGEIVNGHSTGRAIPCSQVKPDDPNQGGGGGGICEIDPSACPKQRSMTRPHPLPPQLAAIEQQQRGHSERARILEGHRALCARNNMNECMRSIEIEIMRLPYWVYDDERNSGAAPAFDVLKAARDLCAKNGAEACTYLASLNQDLPTAIRACDLGSVRGCAIAGSRLGRTGPNGQRASSMLARACAGGIRWACSVR